MVAGGKEDTMSWVELDDLNAYLEDVQMCIYEQGLKCGIVVTVE
jgi:hypothetical protein